MEKMKIKQIVKELGLDDQPLFYVSDNGGKFLNSNQVLPGIYSLKGRPLKEIYRVFLNNKNDKAFLLNFLADFAAEIESRGYDFTNSKGINEALPYYHQK